MRILAALVGLLAALSPVETSAQVIFGCIKPNGTLRVVGGPTQCAANETPISWNQVGSEGPPGPEGPTGPAGPAGPAGSVLVVFDGAGTVLGIPWGGSVFNEELGLNMEIVVLRGLQDRDLLFTEPNCQGQAYIDDRSNPQQIGFAAQLLGPYPEGFPTYFVTRTEVDVEVGRTVSRLSPTACFPYDNTSFTVAIPADPFMGTLPFPIPVPEPIFVGIAP